MSIRLTDLKITVSEVRGTCRARMVPGDSVIVRGELLEVSQGRGFCLYALNAVLPYLLARERQLDEGDWLGFVPSFDCPEADRTVRMTVEALPNMTEGLPDTYQEDYMRTLAEDEGTARAPDQ